MPHRPDDPRLERWLEALLETPGLTAVTDREAAWQLHVADALAARDLLEGGPIVDVGSGGGSPGIPLAAVCPELEFVLLDANARRCRFLEAAAAPFGNVRVVCARAEDHGAGAGRERYGGALARALAEPAVALEWCLPLVAVGGVTILFAGQTDLDRLATVSGLLGGGPPEARPVEGSAQRSLVVVRKVAPTSARFPRRTGAARKRPLA